MLRQCQRCRREKPIEEFAPKGLGRLHVCRSCVVARDELRPPPDTVPDVPALLAEIRDLLASPVCSVCGRHGANRNGNEPPRCRSCRA